MRISDWSSDVCSSDLGGAKADVLNGGAGDDILLGGAGDDTINGGDGDDVIFGGDGADIMHGGAGDDIFAVTVTQFNSERDEVFGDAGDNTLAIDGGGSATANIADVGFNGRYHDVTRVLLSNGDFSWVAGSYSEDAGVETIEIDTGATGNISIINRSEEHTSELQSLMRISYAVFCLKKKKKRQKQYY